MSVSIDVRFEDDIEVQSVSIRDTLNAIGSRSSPSSTAILAAITGHNIWVFSGFVLYSVLFNSVQVKYQFAIAVFVMYLLVSILYWYVLNKSINSQNFKDCTRGTLIITFMGPPAFLIGVGVPLFLENVIPSRQDSTHDDLDIYISNIGSIPYFVFSLLNFGYYILKYLSAEYNSDALVLPSLVGVLFRFVSVSLMFYVAFWINADNVPEYVNLIRGGAIVFTIIFAVSGYTNAAVWDQRTYFPGLVCQSPGPTFRHILALFVLTMCFIFLIALTSISVSKLGVPLSIALLHFLYGILFIIVLRVIAMLN